MLKIWNTGRSRNCAGVSRRDFLQVGSLGVAGLTLPQVLRSRAAATESQKPKKHKSVVLYWLDGGPTHFETYDPKPAAPAEYRGPLGAIKTNVEGILLSE